MRVLRTFFLTATVCAFATISIQTAASQTGCSANAAARQLDYWLGDWSVDSGNGYSSVHRSLDDCLLIESWGSNRSAHRGENVIAFSPEQKLWYGLFADNQGRVHSMQGSVQGGTAEFTGPGRDENGASILKRVKVVRVNDTTVQQIWEKSTDNGATWTLEFKMDYIRKKN